MLSSFLLRVRLSGLQADRQPRPWRKWALRGLLGGPLVALLVEIVRVLFAGNTHAVVPGRVYRSAQLSADDLGDLIEKDGIRTIINLRGCNVGTDWYQDECHLAHRLNISQEDVTFSANRLPAISELRRLIEVMDHTEYPIVLHCKQGADRTGLASAVYLMLYSDIGYATARRECGYRYAHVPLLSTVNMDRFFDQYEGWLAERSLAHSPKNFRQWALRAYCPAPAPARLELIEPTLEFATNEAVTLTLRAHNISSAEWTLKSGTAAAVHARYQIYYGAQQIGDYQAGLFQATVPPGGFIDLDLPFPPFNAPGNYRVNVNMADRLVNFSQLGSEPLSFEFVVRDHQGR